MAPRLRATPDSISIRLPALRTVNQLSVYGCPGVTEVDLDALETVGYSIAFVGNENLATVHGLPSLMSVQYASFSSNPMLPQCEVDAILERLGLSCGLLCQGNDEQATCN